MKQYASILSSKEHVQGGISFVIYNKKKQPQKKKKKWKGKEEMYIFSLQ